MAHILIFGLGYTAGILAKQLSSSGWQVSATSRSLDGVARIHAQGYRGFQFGDSNAPSAELVDEIATVSHIVISAPPSAAGDPVLELLSEKIAGASNLKWVGYLSTIGVYGHHDGNWIDETTTPTPGSTRSKRRLAAELAWQQLADAADFKLQIFRLAGIYGPGRSAIDKLRSGQARAIIKPGQVFNRIHVEDAAAVVFAAANGHGSHSVYNVTDDLPAPPQDVLDHAAKLIGAPLPDRVSLEDAALSEMARSFYAENKRVRNQRIKDDLGVALAYPTYKDGLKIIRAIENRPQKW